MAAAGRASKRVAKELEKFQQAPVPGLEVSATEGNPNEWIVQVTGAEGTIYNGEQYQLRVTFSASYPMDSPEVVFLTPAPMHPHIYSNGHICLSILYDEWSPALTVQNVCLSILSMMSSCTRKEWPVDNDSYVVRVRNRSPKQTRWSFHDDSV